MRKDSLDDLDVLTLNKPQLLQKLEKLQGRAIKTNDFIEDVINRTISAIEESEKEINKKQDVSRGLIGLHNKMMDIKPLKSVKQEYNDFYKKLSGIGKHIQEMPEEKQQISVPSLFSKEDLLLIEQQISDHYLSQEQYEAAVAICPSNNKQKLFEEIFSLNKQVLEGKFDKASQWIQRIRKSHCLNEQDDQIAYQILKIKVINLVKQNKGDEALAYLRNNMAVFSGKNGEDISKLGNFIITQSSLFWGSQRKYLGIFQDRYKTYSSIQLEEISQKLTHLYLKINQITIYNPITKCYEVGYEWRKQFLQYLRYLPKAIDLPKVLPFSIKTGPSIKYHSQFFCHVNKEIYKSSDKIIMLDCGHMISEAAITRIIEGRDIRRRIKCPICQSDQYLENKKKVRKQDYDNNETSSILQQLVQRPIQQFLQQKSKFIFTIKNRTLKIFICDLIDVVREKKICFEKCPVSYLLLSYVKDPIVATAQLLLGLGVPVSISHDGPGNFGLEDTTMDYFVAFISSNWDLWHLKLVARHSINYAICSEELKKEILQQFEKRWNAQVSDFLQI